MADPTGAFPLLRLPPELRSMIYEFLPIMETRETIMGPSRTIPTENGDNSPGLRITVVFRSLPVEILATCKLIRHEALPVLQPKIHALQARKPEMSLDGNRNSKYTMCYWIRHSILDRVKAIMVAGQAERGCHEKFLLPTRESIKQTHATGNKAMRTRLFEVGVVCATNTFGAEKFVRKTAGQILSSENARKLAERKNEFELEMIGVNGFGGFSSFYPLNSMWESSEMLRFED